MTMNAQFQPATPMALKSTRPRLTDIDRAKGLMMILVVLGHISEPGGPQWATTFRALVYGFHMPVFMYLSGFVFVYVSSHMIKPNFGQFVWRRATRLLGPFLVMAFIIINMKILGQHLLTVNKPVGSIATAYASIFFHTSQSPVLAIWYLFVLFVFSVITPIAYYSLGQRFWPLIIIGVFMEAWFVRSLYNGGLTDDFYINRMFWFYVFFVIGCTACKYRKLWISFVERFWWIFAALIIPTDYFILGNEWRYLVVGFVAAVGIHGMMRVTSFFGADTLLFLGDYALAIYLFNTVFIGLAHGLLAKIVTPSDHMILVYLVYFPVGLIGPIILYRSLNGTAFTRPLAGYLR